ncbi:hypothetical protein AAY473_025794, partial [Plecturocebus cupreus]
MSVVLLSVSTCQTVISENVTKLPKRIPSEKDGLDRVKETNGGRKVHPASFSPPARWRRPTWSAHLGSEANSQRPPASFRSSAPASPRAPLDPAGPFPRTPVLACGHLSPAQPATASAQGRPADLPDPERQLLGASVGDTSPEPQPPRPEQAPSPHTHHGAPSRVLDADSRSTPTAAAAAAEGWSSPSPSPTTRGRPAKPQPPAPPPHSCRHPCNYRHGRAGRPPGPLEPSPLARAPGGGASDGGRRGRLLVGALNPAVSCAPPDPVPTQCEGPRRPPFGLQRGRRSDLEGKPPHAPSCRDGVFAVLPRLVSNSWPHSILLPHPSKALELQRWGFSMLVRLVLKSRPQVIHLSWPPKVLGLP